MSARHGVLFAIGVLLLAAFAVLPPFADPCAVLGEGLPCSPESIGFCYAEFTLRLPVTEDCIDVFLRVDCQPACDRGLCPQPAWARECVSLF